MKKQILLATLLVASFNFATAQCTPSDHDWMGATFGVSPDPQLGETFDNAFLGLPYNDVVYVLAPISAADVDPLFPPTLLIDSISLDSIAIFNGLADVQLSNIGLNVTCNNGDDSPNPCMFMPGNMYCGDITGIPNVPGNFPVTIYATVYINLGLLGGVQAIGYSFTNYSLNVIDPDNIEILAVQSIEVFQNIPNPASNFTEVQVLLMQPDAVQLDIMNLVGEKVYSKTVDGKRGTNIIKLNTSEFESGVYLYSVQCADKKVTKRMVVQR